MVVGRLGDTGLLMVVGRLGDTGLLMVAGRLGDTGLLMRGCRMISRSAPIRLHTITHRSGVQSYRSNRNAPNRSLSLNTVALPPSIERPL